MGKKHHLTERRQEIVDVIRDALKMSAIELSKIFNVSVVTIRQDLQSLHDQGLILRTRGGAVSISKLPESSFDVRQQQHASQKSAIGKEAAAMIEAGDCIFLDASTTAHAIIPHLKKHLELTVITNSLKVVLAFLDSPHINIIVLGGNLRRESISLVGHTYKEFLSGINIQIGFFGAHGFSLKEGLTDININEVNLKRDMVIKCEKAVGVFDSRKWNKTAAYTFIDLNEIDTIISDKNAPEDMISQIEQQNISLILV